jgi:hypothetical protein
MSGRIGLRLIVLAGLLVGSAFLIPARSAPAPTSKKPPVMKKVQVGKNVVLEVQGENRRVIINAAVCLREGLLEHLLTRKNGKEHEAILAADIDARHLHTALLLTGAKPGSTVQFAPRFKPASGTTITIHLRYQKAGKTVTVPASAWVRHTKTKKPLPHHWVFAGSFLVHDKTNKNGIPAYGANDGDVICLSNFAAAALDLPVFSSSSGDELEWEANEEAIPAMKTQVEVILEPVKSKKPAGKDR